MSWSRRETGLSTWMFQWSRIWTKSSLLVDTVDPETRIETFQWNPLAACYVQAATTGSFRVKGETSFCLRVVVQCIVHWTSSHNAYSLLLMHIRRTVSTLETGF